MKQVLAALLAFTVSTGTTMVALRDAEPLGMEAAAAEEPIMIDVLTDDEVLAGLDAPIWEIGYGWDLVFPSGFECGAVVVDDTEGGYRQGYVCDGAAFLAVQLEATPLEFMGNLTYALNGFEDGDEVPFFSWPLRDGAEWEMELGGNTYDVTARFDVVEGPFGEEPGYVMEAEFDGGSDTVITWNYVPSIAWWSRMEFSSSGYAVEVTGFNPRFDGVAVTGEVREGVNAFVQNGPLPVSNSFGATAEDEVIYLVGTFGGQYSYDVQLRRPDGSTTYNARGLLPLANTGALTYLTDAEPGTWTVQATGFALPGSARLVVYAGYGVPWDV